MSKKPFSSGSNLSNTQIRGKYLTPFQRKLLQKSAQGNLSKKQRQRIEIMLLTDEGKTQTEICQKLGCCQATARHWIMMAKTNQAHNWQSQPIGRPATVNQAYLERLKQLVSQSPQSINVPHRDYQYPFRRWTAQKLNQHLKQELGIELTPQHINRLLKQMGLSTRPIPSPKSELETDFKNIQITDLDCFSPMEDAEPWHLNPPFKVFSKAVGVVNNQSTMNNQQSTNNH